MYITDLDHKFNLLVSAYVSTTNKTCCKWHRIDSSVRAVVMSKQFTDL